MLPDIPADATEVIRAVARDGDHVLDRMIRGRTQTGGDRHIRVHFFAIEHEGERATAVVAEDVTAQATAEASAVAGQQLLSDVLDSMPAQIAVIDRAGRITAVNQAWRDFADEAGAPLDAPDWTTMNYLDVCRGASGPEGAEARTAAEGIRGVIDGRDAQFQLEYPCHAPDRLRWFVMHAATLTGGDGAVIMHHDITERRTAELELGSVLDRLRLLERLGLAIDRALTPDRIAEVLAREVGDALDAVCLVRLSALRGEPATARAAGPGEDRHPGAAASLAREGMLHEAPPGREPAILDVTTSLRDEDPLAASIADGLGIARLVHVPILFDRLAIGAITAFLPPDRHPAPVRELLIAMSARAAPSLKAARLNRRRERASNALQRGLLPGPLPDVPGLEVATAYRPGIDHLEVGGDFYDLFPVDGGWMATIGDVSGKGADAAPRSAAARQTLRVSAGYDPDPVSLLRNLDRAVSEQQDQQDWFCTAAVLLLCPDDDGWVVRAASAGQPPMQLRRADGTWDRVPAHGSLLGALQTPQFTPASLRLAPGDLLIAFTDGVPDAGAPEQVLGADEIAAACSACTTADEVVDAVVGAAMDAAGGAPRDDLAIVALRVSTAPVAG